MTSLTEKSRPSSNLIFKSLMRADLLVLIKNRRSFLLSIILPLMILITTHGPKAQNRLGGDLLIIGLAISYGLMATSLIGYSINVARDREKGVFQRLRVTPASPWMIMSSRLAVQVIANLIIALVVVIVGTFMYHLRLSIVQYSLVLLISIIGGAAFLSIGQAIVGIIKSSDTVNAAGRIIFIALILLGLLGLTGALGATFSTAAKWSPVGVVMSLFAGVLDLSKWSNDDTLSLLICVLYSIVFAGIGIRWFSWDSQ